MRYVLLAALVLLAACDRGPQPNPAAHDSVAVPMTPPAPGTRVDSVTGVGDKFDALAARQGTSVGSLEISKLDVKPATQTPVGVSGQIRFQGQLELSGNYRPHYEYPEVKEACFYPFAEDWKKVPRAKGDERAIWFCFANQEDAIRQLGPLGTQAAVTIVVEDYTANLALSNVWDTARLVRVVAKH